MLPITILQIQNLTSIYLDVQTNILEEKEKKEQMDTVRTTVKVLDRESVNKHNVVTTADIAADSLLLLDMVCQLFCKHYQINLPLPSYNTVGIS